MPGPMAAEDESESLVDDDHTAGSGEENVEYSSPPESPASPPYSAPQSPASPPQSPLSAAQSPSPPPQSPLSGVHSPSSPPHSAPQSPSSPSSPAERQSEEEDQVSDAEASDDEGAAHSHDEMKQDHEGERSDEENDGESSEKEEKQQNTIDDSEPEENIPEINIDSADEDEDQRSDKQSVSGNEMEPPAESEDEKDDQHSINNESDDENKIDEDEAMSVSGRTQRSASPATDNESPQSPASSPLQEKTNVLSDNEAKSKGAESDAEENADSASDAESDESEVGGLIADIFGESDDDEEFEGFNEEDIASGKAPKDSVVKGKKEKKKRSAKIMSESEDEAEDNEQEKEEKEEADGIIEDLPAPTAEEEEEEEQQNKQVKKKKVEFDDSDDDGDRKMREDFISDFDLMMQKKKEESSKRRKRRDVDLISDSDDLIADIISQMRQAAEEDKELNRQKKTATKKLKILPMVMSQLKKQDLKMAFLDQGVLNVIAEWMTPLPDRSLPHLNIREGMLKQLSDFPTFDQSLLKSSGIGRALMYLYKHPKETKENREKAGRLITEWARPIFNVTTNYHSLTKEEREQRDYDHVPKRRKLKDQESSQEEEVMEKKDIEKEMTGEQKSLRPGDKGWIARARVPMPSTKDYVNRPKWNVEMEFGRQSSKKPLSRLEKHMRMLQEKKRLSKGQRAITISIEGRKMAI